MNIYYKNKVEEYNNEDCFLLYFPKKGMFINTFRRPKHLFNDKIVEWFNDFDKNEKIINKLKNRLNNAALSIYKTGVLHIPQDIVSRSIAQEIFGFISKINRE